MKTKNKPTVIEKTKSSWIERFEEFVGSRKNIIESGGHRTPQDKIDALNAYDQLKQFISKEIEKAYKDGYRDGSLWYCQLDDVWVKNGTVCPICKASYKPKKR